MAKNKEKYTHPRMREEIKEQIKADDKGGKKDQWSARKSQLLTQTYEKRGGGYKGGERSKPAEPRKMDRRGVANARRQSRCPRGQRDRPLSSEESMGATQRR